MADPRQYTTIVSPSPTSEEQERNSRAADPVEARKSSRHSWEVRDVTAAGSLASGYEDSEDAALAKAQEVLEQAEKAEAERLSGYENPYALDDPELAAHPEKVAELQRAAQAGDQDAAAQLANARPASQVGPEGAQPDVDAVQQGRASRSAAVQGASDASETGLANAQDPVQSLGPDDAAVPGFVEGEVSGEEPQSGKQSGAKGRGKG